MNGYFRQDSDGFYNKKVRPRTIFCIQQENRIKNGFFLNLELVIQFCYELGRVYWICAFDVERPCVT